MKVMNKKISKHKFIEERITIGKSITGIITKPEVTTDKKFPMILLFHGFGVDKDEVCGIYKTISNKLKDFGIASIRIDFKGCGDRKNPLGSIATINEQVEDAKFVYCFVKNLSWVNPKKIGACGFSMGAAVALITAGEADINYYAISIISPAGKLLDDFEAFLGKDVIDEGKRLKIGETLKIELPWRTGVSE